tara:strand:+ start:1128 stop:2429 length:1302 start_codon:yes stop_codon:yes gene_type:complete
MAVDSEFLDVHIVDLTHDGRGIANLGDRRVFVSGALPGERILLAPRRRRRQYHEADLIELIEPSSQRVDPPCEYFKRCGGCAVQHLSYEAQVDFKQKTVKEAFARIGSVGPDRWLQPIIGSEWHYRRRARLGVRYVQGKDRVLVGFKERATRYVTDMSTCRVLVEPLDMLPGALSKMIGRSSLSTRLPQAEIVAGDDVRAMVLRILDEPNEQDLKLFGVMASEWDINIYLQRGGPGTVFALNPEATDQLYYRLNDFGLCLYFGPTDFIQVNATVNASLVSQVVDFLQVESTDQVLDLYCGIGNFSLPLAMRADTVLGVEGDAGLVARAAKNATKNNIENISFITADLSESNWSFMEKYWDIVLLDPPRSGAQTVIEQMAIAPPRRIGYVSCHPATLARDAKQLIKQGYRMTVAGIADMFPHTHHVEVMAIFDR